MGDLRKTARESVKGQQWNILRHNSLSNSSLSLQGEIFTGVELTRMKEKGMITAITIMNFIFSGIYSLSATCTDEILN
jgi:hypothetical protein